MSWIAWTLYAVLGTFAVMGGLFVVAITLSWLAGVILRASCRRGDHEPICSESRFCVNCGCELVRRA